MQNFIIITMQHYGYLGIFFLIVLEIVFPPIPSEAILLIGGFLTKYSNLKLSLMILASTLASIIGAIILYYLGYILNKSRLEKIVESKIGKLLHLKMTDINKADEWFSKKGSIMVIVCRFIPVVRSLISIPAGMNKMPLLKFILYTTIGSLIWNIILLLLGYILGANYQILLTFFHNYESIIKIILIALLLIFILELYKKRKNTIQKSRKML